MDAREQHRVVGVSARPSSWQLAELALVRAWAGAYTLQLSSIHGGLAARAAEPIGRLSDWQLFATAGKHMNPTGSTRTAPIQYP